MSQKKFVICVKNVGDEASLDRRKLYEVLEDADAQRHGQLRVVDESGEDHLFPADYFASVTLPAAT